MSSSRESLGVFLFKYTPIMYGFWTKSADGPSSAHLFRCPMNHEPTKGCQQKASDPERCIDGLLLLVGWLVEGIIMVPRVHRPEVFDQFDPTSQVWTPLTRGQHKTRLLPALPHQKPDGADSFAPFRRAPKPQRPIPTCSVKRGPKPSPRDPHATGAAHRLDAAGAPA